MNVHARVIGTGSYIPARIVGNEEVSGQLSIDGDAVYRLTGIRERHWVHDEQASSDLAEEAARRACESAGIPPNSIDAVIVSSTSPDMAFPSTACLVQSRLGIKGGAAFDQSASCSGFLYGLAMADRFIRCGQYRRCLVVAAEVKSRSLDPTDADTAIIFGDGAGAVVVERQDVEARPGIVGIRLYADGTRHRLIGIAAGGSRRPVTPNTLAGGEHVLRMQGGPLFRIAVKRLAAAAADLLKEYGYASEHVASAIFHQANARLLEAVRRRLHLLPEQVYSVIERLGNASSASLPIALDCANQEGRLKSGDLLLLGAFGGGLTWATGLLRW